MKTGILFFLSCLIIPTLFSQIIDTALINKGNKFAFSIHEENQDTALIICQDLLQKSEQGKYLRGQGDAYVTMGAIYRNSKDLLKSYACLTKALTCRRALGDSSRIAAVYVNIALTNLKETKYDAAIANVLYAIGILEADPKGDKMLLGNAYILASNIYDEYLEPTEAYKYAKSSLETYVKMDETEYIAQAAYALANRCLAMNQLDSAMSYYNLAFNNFIISSNDPDYLANIYINKALIYKQKDNLEEASKLFQQAEETLKQVGENADYYPLYLNVGELLLKQEKLVEGLAYLNKAKQLNNELSHLDQQYLYEHLAYAYNRLNKTDSAFYYLEKVYKIRDTIYNENKRKEFVKFQTERYKKETLMADAKVQTQASRMKLLVLTAILLSIVIGVIVYANRQRKRAFQLITDQKEKLHKQAVDELIQASELKYLNAGLEGQEIEKDNIAREIHDRLGSAMVTLTWQYDAVLENLPQDSPNFQSMLKLNAALKNLYQDIRHIAHQLGSGVLERVGLVPVLQELCQDINSTNKMEVDFSAYGMEQRLGFYQEVNLLRIVQELISNVLKYARASQLLVQIDRMDDTINMMIEDDGIGFDPKQVNGHGVGLKNVEGRVRALNGTIQFEQRPTKGTTVIINIPIEETKQNEQIT